MRLCRPSIAIFLSCLSLVGCQVDGATKKPKVVDPVSATVPEPVAVGPTDIALMNRGGAVTVGIRAEDALRVYAPPTGSSEFQQLPPGFAYPYRARNWETATSGFGVVTYNERVVAAVYHTEKITDAEVQQTVREHQDRMNGAPATLIAGKRVTYWFWEQEGQRLMLMSLVRDRQSMQFTSAMGEVRVMDAIGATVEKAKSDQVRVDQILTDRDASKVSRTR